MHRRMPLSMFKKCMQDYIGKYSPKDKNELTPLQVDVKKRIGIVVDLRDPVYAPTDIKLNNMWAQCEFDRIGGGGTLDQERFDSVLQAFDADPENKGHLMEYQLLFSTNV